MANQYAIKAVTTAASAEKMAQRRFWFKRLALLFSAPSSVLPPSPDGTTPDWCAICCCGIWLSLSLTFLPGAAKSILPKNDGVVAALQWNVS